MSGGPVFTITYSRNWDGGAQEYGTARDAVQAVFPDSKIMENCVDKYPIKVIIEAKVGSTKVKIWEGRQQSLFRKNSGQRTKSIAEIKQNLEDLKEDFE